MISAEHLRRDLSWIKARQDAPATRSVDYDLKDGSKIVQPGHCRRTDGER